MSVPGGHGPAKRVLIVDDSVDTARMMKLLLRREGFEAQMAHDGPSALEAAGRFAPHVVLLDLTLPGMSGPDVALALRGDAAHAGTLIVAVSGYGDDGLLPGFDHRMVKPVDHDALLRLLADHAPA